ncbi:hypothetical protein JTE90_003181 [Oedothorax gibbosus]|uniref:Uncharacterized protein n=1 Tax=Oedothorax gibbosus TaxID=931172 RepID=A0AAV6UQU3_9ARAC|nr:hypothetical protein JTE90_003181 [Oedothorax gibbosus]
MWKLLSTTLEMVEITHARSSKNSRDLSTGIDSTQLINYCTTYVHSPPIDDQLPVNGRDDGLESTMAGLLGTSPRTEPISQLDRTSLPSHRRMLFSIRKKRGVHVFQPILKSEPSSPLRSGRPRYEKRRQPS